MRQVARLATAGLLMLVACVMGWEHYARADASKPPAGQAADAAPPSCSMSSTRALPPRPLAVDTTFDVEYANRDGLSLRLDIYRPRVDQPSPVIVWIHGGGWAQGDKRPAPARGLAQMGYAVVAIQYRLSTDAPFPAQIHDCKAAIRWIRANAAEYRFDAARVGVWGASAGAHLAALLGTSADERQLEGPGPHPEQSSGVQAVCDWFGPTDLLELHRLATLTGFRARNERGLLDLLLGGPVESRQELAVAASPISYIRSGRTYPPMLIMHGDRDTLVPLSQSQLLEQALRKVRAPVELVVVRGAGHGFGGREVERKVLAFFDTHLMLAPAKPPTTAPATAPATAPSGCGMGVWPILARG